MQRINVTHFIIGVIVIAIIFPLFLVLLFVLVVKIDDDYNITRDYISRRRRRPRQTRRGR